MGHSVVRTESGQNHFHSSEISPKRGTTFSRQRQFTSNKINELIHVRQRIVLKMSQTPRLVPPAVYALGYPDRVRVLSLIGELRRVMEHQDGTNDGDRAVTRRLKVTTQDLRLANSVVGEKAIGRFGVGPILANQWNALPHRAPDLRYQPAEALIQAFVHKAATSKLAIEPCVRSPVHWHRPLRFGARQGITADSSCATVCALPQRLR